MQSGWVKIHRKIMDSSVWGDPNTLKVWMWCLLRAGHKESKIMFAGEEITVPIGAFISGRASGSTECNMPQSTFRNAVQRLVKLGMISLKSDNKKSLYLVVKYMDYQILTCETGQQEDSKRTTTGQQEDTNKNEELSIKNDLKYSCDNEPDDSPTFLSFPVKGSGTFPVTEKLIEEYQALYPTLNVRDLVRDMYAWLVSNPAKQKTKRGSRAFINNWLTNAKAKAPAKQQADIYHRFD